MDEHDTPQQPRAGSGQDLSRRMDRMEGKYDSLATDVASLKGTVARVETNMQHTAELNTLRFAALDLAVGTVGAKLDTFMARIEGIVTGEIQTGAAKDYLVWRTEVDRDREEQVVLNTQIRSYGRLAAWLIGGNVLGLIVGVLALIQANNP